MLRNSVSASKFKRVSNLCHFLDITRDEEICWKIEPYPYFAVKILDARKYSINNIFFFLAHFALSIFLCDLNYREINNKWALQRAKANVVEWYPVVGILECMEQSIDLLEYKFPYFFRGAKHSYKKIRK